MLSAALAWVAILKKTKTVGMERNLFHLHAYRESLVDLSDPVLLVQGFY